MGESAAESQEVAANAFMSWPADGPTFPDDLNFSAGYRAFFLSICVIVQRAARFYCQAEQCSPSGQLSI